MLIILWKFIILMITQVDVHGSSFDANRVWKLTCIRLTERLNAHRHLYRLRLRQAAMRGVPSPNPLKASRCLEPIATIDEEGNYIYATPFLRLLHSKLDSDTLRLDTDEGPTDSTPKPKFTPVAFVPAKC